MNNQNIKQYTWRDCPLEASLTPECDPDYQYEFDVSLKYKLRPFEKDHIQRLLVLPLIKFLESKTFWEQWKESYKPEVLNDVYSVTVKDYHNNLIVKFIYCDGYLEYSYPKNSLNIDSSKDF